MEKNRGTKGNSGSVLSAAFLSALLIAVGCSVQKTEPKIEALQWQSKDGQYNLVLPEGWDYEDQNRADIDGFVLAKKILKKEPFSVTLAEPATLIRVAHYKEENGYFRSPEEYVNRVAPNAQLRRERVGQTGYEVAETTFKEYFPPESTQAREFETRSRHVVLRKDREFWVFEYTASGLRFNQHLPVLQRMVRQFKSNTKVNGKS